MLGEKDDDWASFAYLWPNYVRIDQKNINNGTGSADDKDKTRKANLHSTLALATQNNAQAREIMESRQTPNVGGGNGDDDGDEPELDGEADFAALRAHFEPKLQIYVGLKMKELDSCFEGLFVSWESNFGDAISKLQAVVRECGHLRCKPSEQQLITKFLGVMPDSGPWGQRKVMWTESTMNADGMSTDATLADMVNKARMAYLQLKNSPEAKSGTPGLLRAWASATAIFADTCTRASAGTAARRRTRLWRAVAEAEAAAGKTNAVAAVASSQSATTAASAGTSHAIARRATVMMTTRSWTTRRCGRQRNNSGRRRGRGTPTSPSQVAERTRNASTLAAGGEMRCAAACRARCGGV